MGIFGLGSKNKSVKTAKCSRCKTDTPKDELTKYSGAVLCPNCLPQKIVQTKGKSGGVGGLVGMIQDKTFREIETSLRSNIKDGRLTFHDNGTTDYTDKKGNHGVYTDAQLSAVLWKIFDDAFSSVKYGGMTAGLAMLGITELDIQDIIKKVRGN